MNEDHIGLAMAGRDGSGRDKDKDKGAAADRRDDPQQPAAADLALPHERDEATAGQRSGQDAPGGPRAVIDQAARDIRRGLVDTERRGAPSDVPGPGRDPEHTDGTVVPAEGVDRERHRRRKPGKRAGG